MESGNVFIVIFLCSVSLNIIVGATKCVPFSKFHIDCMPCYCSETGAEYSCLPRICEKRRPEDIFNSHIDKDGRTILTPKRNINHLVYDYRPLPYAVNPYNKKEFLQPKGNEDQSSDSRISEDSNLESLFKSAHEKSRSNVLDESMDDFAKTFYGNLSERKPSDEEAGLREDDDKNDENVIDFS